MLEHFIMDELPVNDAEVQAAVLLVLNRATEDKLLKNEFFTCIHKYI